MLAEQERSFYWLAKETGISHTTLWRLKKGKSFGINFDTLDRMCWVFHCQPGDALTLNGKKRRPNRKNLSATRKEARMISKKEKPFTFKIVDDGSSVLLELKNVTDHTLKDIEILTVFLKDQKTPGGRPSQAHIRFEAIDRILPEEKSILSHTTWINGKLADLDRDQLQRLQLIEGEANPYVLDISWLDAEGKTRFQRIPVGH